MLPIRTCTCWQRVVLILYSVFKVLICLYYYYWRVLSDSLSCWLLLFFMGIGPGNVAKVMVLLSVIVPWELLSCEHIK